MKFSTIRQKVLIPATPKQVYEALTDAKKHTAFTGSKATFNPRIGGSFTAWDGYISGKNLELVKGEKIVQEWVTTEWPKDYPPSRLELTFTKKGNNTEISIVQSDVPAEQAAELEEGWTEFYWEPLKEYFTKKKTQRKMIAEKKKG
jgi:uncharacterized protein YndB with AHSA1/START domain